jgi:ribosome-associated protein
MPEPLREAILAWQRTRTHEGRRRQMQYVGKLIRGADEAPLREAVDDSRLGAARDALALHLAEHWRARLVADDEALGHWIAEHPATDAQRLRSLVRAARRDGAALDPSARQPRSGRELFQFLRPLLAGPGTTMPIGAHADAEPDRDPETRP